MIRQKELDIFAAFYHSKAVFHGYARKSSLDFESAHKFYSALGSAFPDFRVQVLREIEDSDMLAFHYVWEGTHGGPFAGIAPSNRRVRVEGMSFVRFEGEQVIERWNISDFGSLLTQLVGDSKKMVSETSEGNRMEKQTYMVVETFRNAVARSSDR